MAVRHTDPITSALADTDVKVRAGSQKARLLHVFLQHPEGLTDEEAAELAGLPTRSCWWKRCSELREAGLIAFTDHTKMGSAGSRRLLSIPVHTVTGVSNT